MLNAELSGRPRCRSARQLHAVRTPHHNSSLMCCIHPLTPRYYTQLQFTNPLMALLLIAGGLTFMAYALQSPRDKNNAILAAALIIVVTLTCIMSYFQERSASNVMGEPAATIVLWAYGGQVAAVLSGSRCACVLA